MAKRTSAAKRGGKSSSRKSKSTEVEVVEEAEDSGGSWETGVAVLTGVILLAACLVVDYGLGAYGEGLFFK